MKTKDLKAYNQKIRELNEADEAARESMGEGIREYYDNLACQLPGYEEIVMLLNACISLDSNAVQDYEKLYHYYSEVRKILEHSSATSWHDVYKIYYCIGVYSFKFHNYDDAASCFNKCIKDIEERTGDPEKHDPFKTYYIRAMVLLAYSYEYNAKEGPLSAINKIFSQGISIKADFVDNTAKEKIVPQFFSMYTSSVYNAAEEQMKEEIIHLLAHCFSEHSLKLRKENINPSEVYPWEKLSEIFIDYLGEKMVTCKATILAEHGHYQEAIDLLKEAIQHIDKESDRKSYVETAFYIYYFSNRIGIKNEEIDRYREEFRKFAEEDRNKDTKLYAWIVDFRERFGNYLSNQLTNDFSLEELIKNEPINRNMHSYVHPQIKDEQRRLYLAYQIIKSYQESEFDEKENDLFEKCVLFNNLGRNKAKIQVLASNFFPDVESIINILGITLCVYGLSAELADDLKEKFKCDIEHIEKNEAGNQKILIVTDAEAASKYISGCKNNRIFFTWIDPSIRNSTDIEKHLQKICEAKGSQLQLFDDLEYTFKVAYVQETLERCFHCAFRWDEYFIMAPITDNSTFSFQSLVIHEYLELYENEEQDKKLYSDENGYDTTSFNAPKEIEQIPFVFENNTIDKSTKCYYFAEDWVYEYVFEEEAFIPRTLCENTGYLNRYIRPFESMQKRNDGRKKKCKCDYHYSNCPCNEYDFNDKKDSKFKEAEELMFSLSLGRMNTDYRWCTVLLSENRARELNSFMFMLSKGSILTCNLRKDFERLESEKELKSNDQTVIEQTGKEGETYQKDNEHNSNDPKARYVTLNSDEVSAECSELRSEIEQYLGLKRKRMNQSEIEKAESIVKKLKSCEDTVALANLKGQWESLKNGGE